MIEDMIVGEDGVAGQDEREFGALGRLELYALYFHCRGARSHVFVLVYHCERTYCFDITGCHQVVLGSSSRHYACDIADMCS